MEQLGITDSDIAQMLRFTEQYPRDNDSGLPWDLLEDLRQLVPCDFVGTFGQDSARWEFFAEQEVSDTGRADVGDPSLSTPDERALYQLHYWQSTCSYPDRGGDVSVAVRISDLLTGTERGDDPHFQDLARPAGIEHEMMLVLDAGGPRRTLRVLFGRGPGADFSPRDAAVLTLLRPHLQAAFLASERQRQGSAVLTRRQREILAYVALGETNRQIARRLDLSEATVRKHLENIFARLSVTSRTAAIARVGTSEPTSPADLRLAGGS